MPTPISTIPSVVFTDVSDVWTGEWTGEIVLGQTGIDLTINFLSNGIEYGYSINNTNQSGGANWNFNEIVPDTQTRTYLDLGYDYNDTISGYVGGESGHRWFVLNVTIKTAGSTTTTPEPTTATTATTTTTTGTVPPNATLHPFAFTLPTTRTKSPNRVTTTMPPSINILTIGIPTTTSSTTIAPVTTTTTTTSSTTRLQFSPCKTGCQTLGF